MVLDDAALEFCFFTDEGGARAGVAAVSFLLPMIADFFPY